MGQFSPRFNFFCSQIELIEPANESSPITSLLKKNGPTPYHCCFCSTFASWAERKKHLKDVGFVEIAKPKLAPALSEHNDCNNVSATFLYHKDIGIVEFMLMPE